jgi:hypothetical protein
VAQALPAPLKFAAIEKQSFCETKSEKLESPPQRRLTSVFDLE